MSPKNPLTRAQRAAVLALAGTASEREIARRTGISKTAVRRILAEAPKVSNSRTAPAPPADPAVELPTTAEVESGAQSLATLDQWLQLAAEGARDAQRRKDPASLAKFGSLASALLSAKARREPPPAVNPENNPDFKSAALACRQKLILIRDRLRAEKEAERRDVPS